MDFSLEAGRGPAAVLPVLAAALVVSGCGGGETTVTTTQTETETTTRTQTETQTQTTTASRGDRAQTRGCGDVAFAPQSDAGAFGIRATGVQCPTARAIAREAEGAGRSYVARGFSCSGTPGGGELPSIEFTCTRDGEKVTFSAS